jgi:predicted Zn-dependent peptidase
MHQISKVKSASLLFAPFKGLETASIGIFLRNGARHEPANIKGGAHFLEHLLFKGSKKYSCKDIKREIEGRGGSLNGFTSQEATGYYAYFLKKNAVHALDILLDMVLNPLIKTSDVEKERKVVLEEIKMYNDLPGPRCSMLLDKLLWPQHPLGEEIAGSNESVNAISAQALRRFKDSFYTPQQMIISAAGDISIGVIEKTINRALTLKNVPNFPILAPEPLSGLHLCVERKALEQAHICIGFRAPSYLSEDRLAVEIINIILGANMSSRLFEEVREKRPLCYDISTEVKKYRDSGAFIVHIGLDKNKIDEALPVILRELRKISLKQVSEDELSRAKDFFTGQVTMSLERPQGLMFYNAEMFLQSSRVEEFSEIKREISGITSGRVLKLAKEIFTRENMCVSLVGDVEDNFEEKIREICKKN